MLRDLITCTYYLLRKLQCWELGHMKAEEWPLFVTEFIWCGCSIVCVTLMFLMLNIIWLTHLVTAVQVRYVLLYVIITGRLLSKFCPVISVVCACLCNSAWWSDIAKCCYVHRKFVKVWTMDMWFLSYACGRKDMLITIPILELERSVKSD